MDYKIQKNLIIQAEFHDLVRELNMSRGSSVSIESDYGLEDRGSTPDRSKGFLF
jgi:hypothetical protein